MCVCVFKRKANTVAQWMESREKHLSYLYEAAAAAAVGFTWLELFTPAGIPPSFTHRPLFSIQESLCLLWLLFMVTSIWKCMARHLYVNKLYLLTRVPRLLVGMNTTGDIWNVICNFISHSVDHATVVEMTNVTLWICFDSHNATLNKEVGASSTCTENTSNELQISAKHLVFSDCADDIQNSIATEHHRIWKLVLSLRHAGNRKKRKGKWPSKIDSAVNWRRQAT